ncbi:MAG: hypothetical protein NZ482_05940 [Gloeomargarita sp. SKYG98]|nr:hypothetical protein [Gloeomargarita sp. SKYG98]
MDRKLTRLDAEIRNLNTKLDTDNEQLETYPKFSDVIVSATVALAVSALTLIYSPRAIPRRNDAL